MEKIKKIGMLLIGLLLYAIAFNLFIAKYNFIIGGTTGLSIILNSLLGIKENLSVFIMNFGLVILSFIILGKDLTFKSVFASFILPIFINLTSFLQNVFVTDRLIILAVLTALLCGVGIGLVHKAGYTTGGTDILVKILTEKFNTTVGKAIILIDGSILILGLYKFGLNLFLYDILILILLSVISDKIVMGISNYKCLFISTKHQKELIHEINIQLQQSSTIIKSKTNNIMMCIIDNDKYVKLMHILEENDKDIFYIVTDSYQVLGGSK